MWVLGSGLWMAVLLWVLGMSSPDPRLRRDPTSLTIYRLCWLLTVGLLVGVHYRIMTALGRNGLALELDLTAVLLYLAILRLRQPRRPAKERDDDRNADRRGYRAGPAGIPDLRAPAPRGDVTAVLHR